MGTMLKISLFDTISDRKAAAAKEGLKVQVARETGSSVWYAFSSHYQSFTVFSGRTKKRR